MSFCFASFDWRAFFSFGGCAALAALDLVRFGGWFDLSGFRIQKRGSYMYVIDVLGSVEYAAYHFRVDAVLIVNGSRL